MTLNLYTFTGQEIKITKTLPTPVVVSGDRVEGNQDVTAPSFIISSATMPTYNYAYVPDLARYYFVGQVVWIADSLWRLNLRVDVLKTYSDRIALMSGTVRYSNLGSTAIKDPRISMDGVVNSVTTGSIITDNWYYVLKYWDITLYSGTPPINYNIPTVAFMNEATFTKFWNAYYNLTEAKRVIVGNAIIDLSIVHYLKKAGVETLRSSDSLRFMTAGSTESVNVSWEVPGDITPDNLLAHRIVMLSDIPLLGYMDYDTGASWTDGYFWSGQAKWSFLLPFAGTIDMVPNQSGYPSITYCALRVAYEPYENAYVITPYINETVEVSQTVSLPVRTTIAFPIDSQYNNISGQRTAAALGMVGSVAGGAAMLAMGNPLGAVSIASGLVAGINTLDQLNVQENMATTRYAGNNGGVPAFTGTPDPTKIYWIKRSGTPRPGYTDLWTVYGKPDGAFRALSGLSGYYQLSDVILTNMGQATSSERSELRDLLTTGVIA